MTVTTYAQTRVLNARSLHIINRFTGGWTRSLASQVIGAGGIDKWFARQLSPGPISDTYYLSTGTWWSSNLANPLTTIKRDEDGVEGVWEANAHYQAWSLLRRIGSRRTHRCRRSPSTMCDAFTRLTSSPDAPTCMSPAYSMQAPWKRPCAVLSALGHRVTTSIAPFTRRRERRNPGITCRRFTCSIVLARRKPGSR